MKEDLDRKLAARNRCLAALAEVRKKYRARLTAIAAQGAEQGDEGIAADARAEAERIERVARGEPPFPGAATAGDTGDSDGPKDPMSSALEEFARNREIDRTLTEVRRLFADAKADEAIDALEKLIAKYPDAAGAHYYLGIIRDAQEKTDEALTHYKKVLELIEITPETTPARKVIVEDCKKRIAALEAKNG
jgi:tetratricopeptide (TPR) repeat protein